MQFKWLTVPWSNKTKKIQAVQMWEVRWQSRYGQYYSDTRPELECFPSRQEAEAFANSLENAYRLIRHTSGVRVELTKSKTA